MASIRFGNEIRELRRRRDWSQLELAVRSGVGERTIARLEAGIGVPTLDNLLRLAAALGADPGEFVRYFPQPELPVYAEAAEVEVVADPEP